MKKCTLAACVSFTLCAPTAHAADFYGMIGQSTVSLVGTGAWYIDELPHKVETRSLAWSIGLRGESWRAGYISFGKSSVDSLAYYPDAAYSPGQPRGCPSRGCAPENRYRGIFRTDGLFATYEPRWGVFTAGAGVAVLRHRGTVTVDYAVGPNPYLGGPHTMAVQGKTETYSVNCEGDNPRCAPELQATYLLTAGIEGRRWSLNIQTYPNASGTGGISKGIAAIFVGVKF